MLLSDNADPLDILAELNAPEQPIAEKASLLIGSDIEIAARVRDDLERCWGEIIYTEGKFWRYATTHWEAIAEYLLRLAVHVYDGATYPAGKNKPAIIRLSKARVDSVLHEMAAGLQQPNFFRTPPMGINCASGFIQMLNGAPQLQPHHPDHRCRHTLPGRWHAAALAEPPPHSMLYRLLHGVFAGDVDAADKINLLAEVIGAAALGFATRLHQPRAIILKGETAENGKSQILDLARSLLPESAVCPVTAACMGDEKHVVGLVGKLLNACDELSSSVAIASNRFKTVVTGEPVDGRDVYKSRLEFRPVAQHLFATNMLPSFQGGMDRGVQRRLLVLTFNRVIPESERIEGIGRRIGAEEADLLLAWAVAGATRLLQQRNFTLPPSSQQALNDWIFGADPVLAWLAEQVEALPFDTQLRIRTNQAYEQFRQWVLPEGFNERMLPSINVFVQRLQANAKGIEYRRTREGRFFYGMRIKSVTGR